MAGIGNSNMKYTNQNKKVYTGDLKTRNSLYVQNWQSSYKVAKLEHYILYRRFEDQKFGVWPELPIKI